MLCRRPPPPSSGPTLAVAGAGASATLHALAATAAGVEVRAVASRTPARAEELASRLGARACAYHELPAGADLVVVATPPPCHGDHARTATENGVPALVEAPLAATLADADALVAAQEAGASVAYAENLLWAPVVAAARARAADIGPLRLVEARALSPRPPRAPDDERSWGGGALFDLGVHPLALVLALADADPVEVEAVLQSPTDDAVDDRAEVRLRFATGLLAHVEVSWREATPVWDLQVSSATGVVRADILPVASLEVDGEPVALPAGGPEQAGVDATVVALGYVDQLRATLGPAGHSTLDARFGRRVLEVVCAAHLSAATGAAEPVPFRGRRDLTPLGLWRG